MTYTFGIGSCALCATRAATRYRAGASASLTGCAPANESAILSENHHEPKFMTAAMSRAIGTAEGPKKMRAAAMRRSVRIVSSPTVLIVFMSRLSHRPCERDVKAVQERAGLGFPRAGQRF